jgi:MFS superfamily sulfate permease-like transporter
LSAATVSSYATAGSRRFVTMTAALAISAGLAAVIAGVLRLGFLASFISEPVMKGFIVGLALTIIVGQLPGLFGVEKGSGDFFQKLADLIGRLGQTQGLTLRVGASSLIIVLVLRRLAPAVPGSLGVVALGIVAVAIFHLDHHGVEIVGHIDRGLPSFGVPDLPGLFEKLPEATLAAVVVAAVIELVDYRAIARLYRVATHRQGREWRVAGRPDFVAAVAALLGVTVFDHLPGLPRRDRGSLTSDRAPARVPKRPGGDRRRADSAGHRAGRS